MAVDALSGAGTQDQTIILHCTSEYPAPVAETNLRAIHTLASAFNCPVGFSDHTEGVGASPWAVALGACVIEKHFTLSRDMAGPDHRASLDPDGFVRLVQTIREVEAAMGDGIKRPMPSELSNKLVMQKSLVARRPIRGGELLDNESVTSKRPGLGLPPSWLDRVIGKHAAVDIAKDEQLTLASVVWAADDMPA